MFFYIPAGPKEQERLQLLVHSKSGDTATANGIRESARALDPDLIVDVTRLEDNLELWRTPSRIVAALSGVLGGLAFAARFHRRVRRGFLRRQPAPSRNRYSHDAGRRRTRSDDSFAPASDGPVVIGA